MARPGTGEGFSPILEDKGGVINNDSFVTISSESDLPNKRVLTGTANQVTITDGGAGSTVTLSTPQDLDTGADFVLGSLNVDSGTLAVNLTGYEDSVGIGAASPEGILELGDGNIIFVGLSQNIETVHGAAVAGDTLILASGTYTVTDDIDITKAINIVGQGKGKTIITCATADKNVFDITSDNVRISNLSITHSGAGSTNHGIKVNGVAGDVFSNVHIENVDITLTGAAVLANFPIGYLDAGGSVRDCVLDSSGAAKGYGVYMAPSASAEATTTLNLYNVKVTATGSSISRGFMNHDNNSTSDSFMYLYNCSGTASGGSSTNYGLYSLGGDAFSYAENSVFSGATDDIAQGSGGFLQVRDCVLATDTTAGTITYDGTIVTEDLYVDGNVGIGVTDPDEALEVTGNIRVTTDSDKLYLGTAKDAYITYDGTDMKIVTDEVAASDLIIDCGTQKTIELAEVVYKDINIAGYLLTKPASSAPGIVSFIDENGADTTIETYGFAVGELVHGGFEIQHDYKEGTDLVFHVHWQGIAAPSGTDNVQWRLNYIVTRDGTTLNAAVTIDSPDTTIATQYNSERTDFAAITGTNFLIGDQFIFTLTRVASTGDAYAGEALIETAGIHYQIDTIGSRQIATK